MKKVILNVIFRWTMMLGSFILSGHCFAQLNQKTFDEIEVLEEKEPKPIVVFLHTEWCSYCAMMEKTTFRNDEVLNLLNKNFYFTSFNGESEKEVKFAGRNFKFKPTGYKTGVHELAEALGNINGEIAYPTVTILNSKKEIIFQYGGFLDAEALKAILLKLI